MALIKTRGHRTAGLARFGAVALAAGICGSALTWSALGWLSRTSRVARSLARYQEKWQASTFFGVPDARQSNAYHRIFVALQKTDGAQLRQPHICYAGIGVSRNRSGRPKKGAMLIYWIGDHPDANSIMLKWPTLGQQPQPVIPIEKWQVAATRIMCRSGVVYSVVVQVPLHVLAELPLNGHNGRPAILVATSVGKRRTSPWYRAARLR
jgi:hypothetical protein